MINLTISRIITILPFCMKVIPTPDKYRSSYTNLNQRPRNTHKELASTSSREHQLKFQPLLNTVRLNNTNFNYMIIITFKIKCYYTLHSQTFGRNPCYQYQRFCHYGDGCTEILARCTPGYDLLRWCSDNDKARPTIAMSPGNFYFKRTSVNLTKLLNCNFIN